MHASVCLFPIGLCLALPAPALRAGLGWEMLRVGGDGDGDGDRDRDGDNKRGGLATGHDTGSLHSPLLPSVATLSPRHPVRAFPWGPHTAPGDSQQVPSPPGD